MTVVEFLLARIAEDEAEARAAGSGRWEPWAIDSGDADHIARHDPARVLAECEAKRRIVTQAETVSAMDDRIEGEWGVRGSVPFEGDEGVKLLRILAAVYSDHPDCRDEWKP